MRVSPCVVTPAARFGAPVTSPGHEPEDSSRLVLLIEEDECVADILERTLERAGMRVLCARDGAEGAHLFGEFREAISLVMIDCGLPDVSGAALFSVLRRNSPDLPIVLTGGWDSEGARLLAEEGPSAFVAKPFSARQIERVVESLLGVTA